ncbi:MAG: hypothetical protein A2Y10_09565 [Planctomycetes bacterium GWF2_41_51]|nr:MAG: hypothetical protein A2Y10_09565 [Planctomycetes bacterium GWF2_41_51]
MVLKYINEKIRIPVIAPAVIAILLLLTGAVGSLYIMQQRYLNSHTLDLINAVEKSFYGHLNQDAAAISGIIEFLKKDKQLQNIWLMEDRQLLQNYSEPIFKNIESKYNITHFYFHGVDKINFLRVHQPSRYSDSIRRFTLTQAAEDKKTSWGIEVGPLGTFTLRVVEPWFINGSLAGFLELGKEIAHIMPEINQTFKVKSFHIIDKSYLNKASWQEGMKMLGFTGEWDAVADYVIIDYNTADLPAEIVNKMTYPQPHHGNTLIESPIKKDGDYYLGFISLVDAGNRPVGDIVVLKNIKSEKIAIWIVTLSMTVLGGIVGGFLLIIFRLYVRRIEHKLSSIYGQMENNVRERTSELSEEIVIRKKAEDELINLNRKLGNTIKKLTAANYELSEFTNIAAHDLKSPLRAVGSLAGIMHEDYGNKLDIKGKEILDMLIDRCERMNAQLSAVLRYAEISLRDDTKKCVDLNVVLKEIINHFNLSENVEIIIQNQLPVIMCDPEHIKQLFECLLDNAVKFMDKPVGRIRIDCSQEEDFWQFSVIDNGPGIENKYFGKIFKIFQRLTKNNKFKSTGIGLSIAKKIVEIYGGKIWVESEIGKGSTFLFTLSKQQVVIENHHLQSVIAVSE